MSGLIYIAIWTYDSYLRWVISLQWLVAWFVALRERCLIFSPLCLKRECILYSGVMSVEIQCTGIPLHRYISLKN